VSLYTAISMVRITISLLLLLLVLMLRQSDAVSDRCSELQEEIDLLEKALKDTTALKHNFGVKADNCYVSGYCKVCVASVVVLYVAQLYMRGYYKVHVSSL
jgi:hypothetical protein